MVVGKGWNRLDDLINSYEFPEDDAFAAAPEFTPAPMPVASKKPSRSKKASKKSGGKQAVSREAMFAMFQSVTAKADAFVNEYDFPSDSSRALATVSTPVALPVGEALTQIERDADAVFAVLDLDGDGTLSFDELGRHLSVAGYSQGSIANMFKMMDANADSVVSRTELREAFARFATLREAPGLMRAAQNIAEVTAQADQFFDSVQLDEQISKDVFFGLLSGSAYSERAIGAIFDAIDDDHNGQISRDELRGSLTRISALRLLLGLGDGADQAAEPAAEYRYLW